VLEQYNTKTQTFRVTDNIIVFIPGRIMNWNCCRTLCRKSETIERRRHWSYSLSVGRARLRPLQNLRHSRIYIPLIGRPTGPKQNSLDDHQDCTS
jgi:hypothetical protein